MTNQIYKNDLLFSQAQMATILKVPNYSIHRRLGSLNIDSISENSNSKSKHYTVDSVRQIIMSYFQAEKLSVKSKVQVFYNFKGGTGKSTLSSQIAFNLSILGYKVLAIDLDPQGHLTINLGFNKYDSDHFTIFDHIINNIPLGEIIKPIYEGLDIIPSNIKLTRIETTLIQQHRREEILKRKLSELKDQYDFIIIDTNPTLSILNINALIFADYINIVTATHPLSYDGLGVLTEDLKSLGTDLNIEFNYRIIPNLFEAKTATAQEVLGAIRSNYREKVSRTVVRKSEDFNIATKIGSPVISFGKKRSQALEDVIELTYEILAEAHPNVKHIQTIATEN